MEKSKHEFCSMDDAVAFAEKNFVNFTITYGNGIYSVYSNDEKNE